MKEYSVTEINNRIKHILEDDFALNNICIKGEVSRCTHHKNGHIYFDLKDDKSVIKAVYWKSNVSLPFDLKEGDSVIVVGSVSVYAVGGYYQLTARSIERAGLGDLYARLEALKIELKEMGYFATQYKKPIPNFSRRVGIVTAPTGAAVRDIERVARERNPYVELFLYPAIVQGNDAVASIVEGISILDTYDLDVIIIGRGGGSIEDLWAFNDKKIADAIFFARTPIISAVGHEIDHSISDYVADAEAPTPTAAAALAVCKWSDVEDKIFTYSEDLQDFLTSNIELLRNIVLKYELKLNAVSPKASLKLNREKALTYLSKINQLMKSYLRAYEANLERDKESLTISMRSFFNRQKDNFQSLTKRLNAMSPLNLLSSGYGYVEDSSGARISSIEEIKEDDQVSIYFTDGYAKALVKEKKYEKNGCFGKQFSKT